MTYKRSGTRACMRYCTFIYTEIKLQLTTTIFAYCGF